MILSNIQIFIDSGWYTVPYDRIYYNEAGKKVIEPNTVWSSMRTVRNTINKPAGALICGKQLVIDCDTVEAAQAILNVAGFDNIRTLDDLANPEAVKEIGLIVKTTRGYHFYFEGDPDIEDCKGPKIDVQATDKKLVFLPTQASEGKTIIGARTVADSTGKLTIKLAKMPEKLKEYVLSLKHGKEETEAKRKIRFTGGSPLAKVEQGSVLYFKRMTPKVYRADPKYRHVIDLKGYLHPNDIKDGDGNDYMVAVAAILASDPTIDVNMFWDNMRFINSLWSKPLTDDELNRKVRGYAEGQYSGCPFNYDEDWEKAAYSFADVDGVEMTVCYDLNSSKFLVVENESGKTYLKSGTEILSFYANRTGCKTNLATLSAQLPGVEIIFNPLREFGLSEDKKFNIYKHSKYVEILRSESAYSQAEIDDSKDCLILNFFRHLFKDQSDHWLRFLRKKLTTFKYSPTAFCLFDVEGGAGKGALESWLRYFLGKDKVASIPYETWQSKFTSDIEGKLFVFLNEFPDDYKLRKANTDKIKNLTGSPTAKIEKKGQDPYEAINFATYMITSNRVSIEIKDGDRRFCVVQCDAKFDEVFGEGFFDAITSDEEMTKLAIYLKYCVEDLDHLLYMKPPMSEAKEMFLEASSTELDRAVSAIVTGDWTYIEELETGLVLADKDLINLSNLARRLNVPGATLTAKLKPYITSGKLQMESFTDRNKKYNAKICTYGQFKKGIMKNFVDLSSKIEYNNSIKI